jgi:glycine/D-amino acid oxidase-like deaminating enzyme
MKTRAACAIEQATFHPTKYLRGLAERVTSAGLLPYVGGRCRGKDGSVTVTTENGKTVRAKHAVVATNSHQ